jgi:hypothetical protein
MPAFIPFSDDDKLAEGQTEKGNLDPYERKVAYNPDGSISNMVTIGVGTDAGNTIIPSMVEAKQLTPQEAIAHWRNTGENFGTFKDQASMDTFDKTMHQKMAADAEIRKLGSRQPNSFAELLQYLKGER